MQERNATPQHGRVMSGKWIVGNEYTCMYISVRVCVCLTCFTHNFPLAALNPGVRYFFHFPLSSSFPFPFPLIKPSCSHQHLQLHMPFHHIISLSTTSRCVGGAVRAWNQRPIMSMGSTRFFSLSRVWSSKCLFPRGRGYIHILLLSV